MPTTLRLILGDQLNEQHSWFETASDDVIYVMMEMRQETDYTRHHIQKVAGFFAAMRSFSKCLMENGQQVVYIKLDDEENTQNLTENLIQIIESKNVEVFEYQLPDEYRLDQQLKSFCDELSIETMSVDTEHFITKRADLDEFFGKKSCLMESFYRHVRKKHGWLMTGDKPEGDKWNYDHQNRKSLPDDYDVVEPFVLNNDVSEIHKMIKAAGVETMGEIDSKQFIWPINRKQSLQVLDYFLEHCFTDFGNYQDAMHTEHWSVYHARISFALNTKMISPREVVEKAIERYRTNDQVSLAATEGFVRQIIGWREFMRGVYWAKMPEYEQLNELNNTNRLPKFYWTGDTKMNCMRHAIGQSLEHAYAHHIQRLMVTGNFALLAGINPDEVDDWYLGIYIDAIQWVEITNTRGMSQFADGGIIATKPYVSSANYINKMSNYCKSCHYSHSKKTGEKACPFNSLYWNFLDRNREYFKGNRRMGIMYNLLDKKSAEERSALLRQAEHYLENLDEL